MQYASIVAFPSRALFSCDDAMQKMNQNQRLYEYHICIYKLLILEFLLLFYYNLQ